MHKKISFRLCSPNKISINQPQILLKTKSMKLHRETYTEVRPDVKRTVGKIESP